MSLSVSNLTLSSFESIPRLSWLDEVVRMEDAYRHAALQVDPVAAVAVVEEEWEWWEGGALSDAPKFCRWSWMISSSSN